MNKKQKTKINPINKKDNKFFQYNVTVALSHEEIEKNSERITKIKPFINKCKYEGNDPQGSFTIKTSEHILSRSSISTISSFKNTENKYDVHKAKDCMKKLCESLREHTI